MKFVVECDFAGRVCLGGLVLNSIDFTVEAPSARIAEYKVLNCYPALFRCQAKAREGPLSLERKETLKSLLKYFLWTVLAGGVVLWANSNCDLDTALATATPLRIAVGGVYALAILVISQLSLLWLGQEK